MKLGALGEFGLIDRIKSAVNCRDDVVTGIGDDAAVISPRAGMSLLTTTDMLVEGVHFDLSYTSPRLLGHKTLAVNLSDIAAMGGVPRHCYLAMALPSSLSVEFVDEFMAGLLDLAARHDVILAGGDTCASRSGFVVSLTAVGEQLPERIVRRQGARVGDGIFVTGTLGDSALGLLQLRQGERSGVPVMRHLAPEPRLAEARVIVENDLATAMIDVSDGLAADLGHICDCSGVGARVDIGRIPLSAPFRAQLAQQGDHLIDAALSGGEDYELLFTASSERCDEVLELFTAAGLPVSRVGTMVEEGLSFITPQGVPYQLQHSGFNHFDPSGNNENP